MTVNFSNSQHKSHRLNKEKKVSFVKSSKSILLFFWAIQSIETNSIIFVVHALISE